MAQAEASRILSTVPSTDVGAAATAADLYLDLLKKCLTRLLFPDFETPEQLAIRQDGRDWPSLAETMVGLDRLNNVQHCVTDVLHRGVPGDLIETGVWRGGTSIFMRAVLKAYGDTERTVWVADSFRGLPRPNADLYPLDGAFLEGSSAEELAPLAIPLEQVQANFQRYGLLDDQVRFLEGWFSDTLPGAPIGRLAVLRLDGDLYESTITALRWLYPRLSVGGYVIVDDYGAITACREAVGDFRRHQGITEEIVPVDWTGVFWQRLR